MGLKNNQIACERSHDELKAHMVEKVPCLFEVVYLVDTVLEEYMSWFSPDEI